MWLGKKDDRYVAMKQFPKLQGKQVDSSAYVEFHAHEIIKKNSDPFGKPPLPLVKAVYRARELVHANRQRC